jgi:serine/threonine protein kinase
MNGVPLLATNSDRVPRRPDTRGNTRSASLLPVLIAGYRGHAMLDGQHIGPFEIEKELGSGAMGTVYRAKFHRTAEKVVPVAIKVVTLALLGNEGAMARFEREANILKQLKHPHIVRLIAHGKINKANPYIAMEYIDGEALDRVLARRGRLGWEEVVAYGKQLSEALQYAHDKGIIHRDLKPSNLMITREGVLKLTDFGIAKDLDVTPITHPNSTIGTVAYMSPEQCKGDRNLSNKSDLYSLGIVPLRVGQWGQAVHGRVGDGDALQARQREAAANRPTRERNPAEVRVADSSTSGEGDGRPAG